MDISKTKNHLNVNLNDCGEEELLNRSEAAAFLRVKSGTLATWASTKRYNLPYHKVGSSKVLYKLSDLKAFLENNSKGGANE